MENLVLIINRTEDPKHVRHVCFYAKYEGPYFMRLYEVSEKSYPHPEAPEAAFVVITETDLIGEYSVSSPMGASLILHEASERATAAAIKARIA